MPEHGYGIRPRVLIVDDHDDVRAGLRRLLEDSGIEVIGEAEGGLRGVAMAEELGPDVVLMDVRMPYLDGIKATQHIKEAVPGVAVILLTAYDAPTLEADSDELGRVLLPVEGRTSLPDRRDGPPGLGVRAGPSAQVGPWSGEAELGDYMRENGPKWEWFECASPDWGDAA